MIMSHNRTTGLRRAFLVRASRLPFNLAVHEKICGKNATTSFYDLKILQVSGYAKFRFLRLRRRTTVTILHRRNSTLIRQVQDAPIATAGL
ncbi:hypothetical protein MTO96_015244 [Rhipicephalus appendiculatus]